MKFETKAIRLQTETTQHREHSTPLFPTSSFLFEDAEQMRAIFANEQEGNIYSRFTNPNCREFELKMAALEETEDAVSMASGMSAVLSTFLSFLQQGDHILASKAIFGSTYQVILNWLPRWGITHTFVDANNIDSWSESVQANTKMLFVETPSNPGLDIVDLEKAGAFAKTNDLIFAVDNCFATPYLQQPARFGADLVSHSATKFIDGQGRVLGGVVCGNKELIAEIRRFGRNTGPTLSTFNAWILSKSLETLHVRMDRHCTNALALAERLSQHPQISKVNYPFLQSHPSHQIAKNQMKQGGGLVTFELKDGLRAGQHLLNHIKMCSLSANIGDTRTIVTHPASTTHARLTGEARQAVSITDGLIRVSVGLEHIDDIVADIEQAIQ